MQRIGNSYLSKKQKTRRCAGFKNNFDQKLRIRQAIKRGRVN